MTTLLSILGPLIIKLFAMWVDHKVMTKEQREAFEKAIKTLNTSGESARLNNSFKDLRDKLRK